MGIQMITPEGLEKLKAELDHLWRVDRPETTNKVAWAASLGDRSENADYHYNKRRLREIDSRVRYLHKCIDDFKMIRYDPYHEGKVMFVERVEIENDKGLKKRLRIVGYEELIGNKDYISMDSPMAKALLDKKVGDEAIVRTPVTEFVWKINKSKMGELLPCWLHKVIKASYLRVMLII
ncbi:transcription elongation factor GreB [Fulvivirga lutimaris]|uniref:transcription elongation factor GreB n=1 Tax=Fulvivirga lutimaris TaxID=1819566 RepID=UPI0012BBC728|nr:transcription elongation factor GreB [Fulvivirga lutimaris]MTI38014.1 transcription elongation factor GreB [Fulvivirga lutimaris]